MKSTQHPPRRKTALERVDEFLSRDSGGFHTERIQMLRRIMFGDLPDEPETALLGVSIAQREDWSEKI